MGAQASSRQAWGGGRLERGETRWFAETKHLEAVRLVAVLRQEGTDFHRFWESRVC